jgi:hypothetical protein
MKTDPPTPSPAYQVTAVDNFDWYESAGMPTPCRDAEHALSVAKGILERSLAHEHAQAKDPTDPEELFKRWDDFGDYPSIYPTLDPPFDPSEYANQRAREICSTRQLTISPVSVICAAAFPPGTKFFDVEDVPIADPPNGPALGFFTGKPVPVSEKTAMKLGFERQISPEEFDACLAKSTTIYENEEEQDTSEFAEFDQDEDGYDPNCYAFHSEDSYPVGQLTAAIRRLAKRPDLPAETAEKLKVFLFAMERLPLVTPGVRMSLGLRLDQGGESDWIEIRMEDGEFTLGRGAWVDGDADTETVFEVTPGYRDGDAFIATHFAESFTECARDACREVVIEDFSDEPFTAWELPQDKSLWSSLPCSFL